MSDRPRRGRVDEVEPGRRLSFTWWPIDDDGECSAVVITLAPGREGTLVRVTERVAPPQSVPAATAVAWAWRSCLLAHGSTLARAGR